MTEYKPPSIVPFCRSISSPMHDTHILSHEYYGNILQRMIKIQRVIIRSKKLFKTKYKARGNRLNTSQILQNTYEHCNFRPQQFIAKSIFMESSDFSETTSPRNSSLLVDNVRSFARNGSHKYGILARGAILAMNIVTQLIRPCRVNNESLRLV